MKLAVKQKPQNAQPTNITIVYLYLGWIPKTNPQKEKSTFYWNMNVIGERVLHALDTIYTMSITISTICKLLKKLNMLKYKTSNITHILSKFIPFACFF